MLRAYTREPTRPDLESEQTHDDCEWLDEKDGEENVLGHCAMGVGADVRQASLRTRAGTSAGRTIPTPSTAAVMAVTNDGLD